MTPQQLQSTTAKDKQQRPKKIQLEDGDIGKIECDDDEALVFNKEDRILKNQSNSVSEENVIRFEEPKNKIANKNKNIQDSQETQNSDKIVPIKIHKKKDDKIVKLNITQDDGTENEDDED